MPQLDRFAYVSEVIWLIAVFFGMYVVILREYLPKVYRLLRFRGEALKRINVGYGKMEVEKYIVEEGDYTKIRRVMKKGGELSEIVIKIEDERMGEKRKEKRGKREQGVVVGELGSEGEKIVREIVLGKGVAESKYIEKKVI